MPNSNDNLYWPSVCDPIFRNKQLSLDDAICCVKDSDICSNNPPCPDGQPCNSCRSPNKLIVKCHRINEMEACQRKNEPSDGNLNNDVVAEVCKKENLDKHFCLSTNSTTATVPDYLKHSLAWVVNRPGPFGIDTERISSCKTCLCCGIHYGPSIPSVTYDDECYRKYAINLEDDVCNGCDLDMLKEECSNHGLLIKTHKKETIKGAICSDMFESGNCRFYNISTGNPTYEFFNDTITGKQIEEVIWYQPEVCNFITNVVEGLSNSDKIAIGTGVGVGAPGLILAAFGVWVAWIALRPEVRQKIKNKLCCCFAKKIKSKNAETQTEELEQQDEEKIAEVKEEQPSSIEDDKISELDIM